MNMNFLPFRMENHIYMQEQHKGLCHLKSRQLDWSEGIIIVGIKQYADSVSITINYFILLERFVCEVSFGQNFIYPCLAAIYIHAIRAIRASRRSLVFFLSSKKCRSWHLTKCNITLHYILATKKVLVLPRRFPIVRVRALSENFNKMIFKLSRHYLEILKIL